jgi:hypothetical protein
MSRFDITQTNAAVERSIETTENPRHLYLLHAYNRHRYLEMAGRFEEIFTPEMTVENPFTTSACSIGLQALDSFQFRGEVVGQRPLPAAGLRLDGAPSTTLSPKRSLLRQKAMMPESRSMSDHRRAAISTRRSPDPSRWRAAA